MKLLCQAKCYCNVNRIIIVRKGGLVRAYVCARARACVRVCIGMCVYECLYALVWVYSNVSSLLYQTI